MLIFGINKYLQNPTLSAVLWHPSLPNVAFLVGRIVEIWYYGDLKLKHHIFYLLSVQNIMRFSIKDTIQKNIMPVSAAAIIALNIFTISK